MTDVGAHQLNDKLDFSSLGEKHEAPDERIYIQCQQLYVGGEGGNDIETERHSYAVECRQITSLVLEHVPTFCTMHTTIRTRYYIRPTACFRDR